jgi:hypothetical protein
MAETRVFYQPVKVTDRFTTLGLAQMAGATGGAASSALIAGGGTAATRCATSSADKNFLGWWTESTATSGDSRGMYLRHYFSGAGGSGEALRVYGTVNNVTAATGGTVNGAHISLSITGASGAISGSANALRATLDMAATPTAVGGTCSVARFDTNIATGPTIPTGTAFITVDNVSSQKLDYFLRVTNPSTTMFTTGTNTTIDHVLKIAVDGVDYWIGLYDATS